MIRIVHSAAAAFALALIGCSTADSLGPSGPWHPTPTPPGGVAAVGNTLSSSVASNMPSAAGLNLGAENDKVEKILGAVFGDIRNGLLPNALMYFPLTGPAKTPLLSYRGELVRVLDREGAIWAVVVVEVAPSTACPSVALRLTGIGRTRPAASLTVNDLLATVSMRKDLDDVAMDAKEATLQTNLLQAGICYGSNRFQLQPDTTYHLTVSYERPASPFAAGPAAVTFPVAGRDRKGDLDTAGDTIYSDGITLPGCSPVPVECYATGGLIDMPCEPAPGAGAAAACAPLSPPATLTCTASPDRAALRCKTNAAGTPTSPTAPATALSQGYAADKASFTLGSRTCDVAGISCRSGGAPSAICDAASIQCSDANSNVPPVRCEMSSVACRVAPGRPTTMSCAAAQVSCKPTEKVSSTMSFANARSPMYSASLGVGSRFRTFNHKDVEYCWNDYGCRPSLYLFGHLFQVQLRPNALHWFKRNWEPSPALSLALVAGIRVLDPVFGDGVVGLRLGFEEARGNGMSFLKGASRLGLIVGANYAFRSADIKTTTTATTTVTNNPDGTTTPGDSTTKTETTTTTPNTSSFRGGWGLLTALDFAF